MGDGVHVVGASAMGSTEQEERQAIKEVEELKQKLADDGNDDGELDMGGEEEQLEEQATEKEPPRRPPRRSPRWRRTGRCAARRANR